MMKFRTLSLLCLVLLIVTGACGKDSKDTEVETAAEAETEPKWKIPHQKVTEKKDTMIQDLEVAHQVLTERAKVENPELLAILEPEPPKPREYGYGILPEIKESPPLSKVKPLQTFYFIRWLETTFDPEYIKTRELKDLAQADAKAELKPMVDEYDRLKKRLALLENHLSYHLQWQKALVDYPEFFAQKNLIVAKIRTVIKYKGDFEALRKDMLGEVARFIPAKGLQITTDASGTKQLKVPVHTDITDDAFLTAFQEAIEEEYNKSPAAQAKRFRLHLDLIKVDPKTLYPKSVPAKGEHIDIKERPLPQRQLDTHHRRQKHSRHPDAIRGPGPSSLRQTHLGPRIRPHHRFQRCLSTRL